MSVISIDFANVRRVREEFVIALAQAVYETFAEPDEWGLTTAADLADCEAQCRSEDVAAIFGLYRHAVGCLNTSLGEKPQVGVFNDPACHMRTFEWARRYLQQINEIYDLKLGEVSP